jgi:hypothetical protein
VTNGVSTLVSVFRNTGSSGTVSFDTKVDFTTGNSPYSVAIGDIDGDSKPDLAVANQESNTVSVLRNIGSSGTLNFATKVDFAVGTSPYSVAIGDIDGDGKPDLAVVNYYSDAVSVLHNTGISGTVSFATKVDLATGRHPASVAIGDIDGDGKPDLAVANTNSDNVSVFCNIGSSGTPGFAAKVDFTTGNSPYSVAIGDMDGDGKPDLATANSIANQVSVLQNMPAFSSTVTTQAVSDISTNAATGNGDITDLGIPDPTAHGVCWNTTGTPTTEDDFVDEGAVSTTGAFTSNITGLSAGTEYFVRAYVTNSAGTSYGSEVSFTTKQSQTITFNALTDKTYGDADYSPDATAGSGLTVSYSSSNTNVATIVSGKIHIVATGICTIYADQAGNASYDAAPQVSQALKVNTATLSVTAENKSKEYDGTVYSPFTVTYSGFVNGEDEADLSGTLTFSGTATTATDAGAAYVITPAGLTSANYDITFENGSLDITKAAQSITFDPLETKVEGDAPFELTASSTSDLNISYTSSDPDVATISGSTVTIVGAGSTTITASQSGNDNYSPALPIEQMLTVHIYIAGDIDRNGAIDGTEIAGDTDGSGSIDEAEITGDINGNGSIDGDEIAGDANGNGIIDGAEIAGDTNGNGSIDDAEITGDINGNGSIDGDEIAGDADGNGLIDGDEIADSIAVADKESFEVAMYPNPARGIVHLDITTSNVQNVKLTLVDITGRLLLQKQISAAEHITLDMSGKVSGIYFVKFDFEGKQVLKKLVVE